MSFVSPFEKSASQPSPSRFSSLVPETPAAGDTPTEETPLEPATPTPPAPAPQRRGLAAARARTAPADATFDAIFDSDDETAALQKAKGAGTLTSYRDDDTDVIMEALEANYQVLKERHPTGGARAFRFLTADILLAAPPGYFEKWDSIVEEATRWVQGEIASRERSDAIAASQANPTDDSYQDDAFRVIYDVFSEFIKKRHYRGIERYLILSLVTNEIVGFSKIDPLWRDRKIDEIIINGPRDVQIEISGQLHRVPAVTFRDELHVMNLLERLFGSLNKTLTKLSPLVKGRLHDQSRIFAVHQSVAPTGPNVAIRRHPERYWTPEDLVARGSMDEEVATFLGNLVHKGCSFVVIGGTSTGKTSFLNAMTGYYPNDVRILTLEDNLEMRPNPTKALAAAMECKPAAPDRPGSGVTMRDLVKGSLQLRPDGIVIGEVTDGATYDLVQSLNTGHFGASTIHANSEYDGIYRIASLIQQGAELSQAQTLPLIAAAFDFIVLLESFPVDGSRRLVSISEIDPYVSSDANGQPTLGVKQLYHFEGTGIVEGKVTGYWKHDADLSETRAQRRHLALQEDLTWEELRELSSVPEIYQPKKPKE